MAKPVNRKTSTRVEWSEFLNLKAGDSVSVSVTRNGTAEQVLTFAVAPGEKFKGRIALDGKAE